MDGFYINNGYNAFLLHNIISNSIYKNKKIIYISTNKESLLNIRHNLSFFNIDNVFIYTNHFNENNDNKMFKIHNNNESNMQDLRIFFNQYISNEISRKSLGFNLLLTDYQTFLNQSLNKKTPFKDNTFETPLSEINFNDFIDLLVRCGYDRVPVAESYGEFAVRGEIIDIGKQKTSLDICLDKMYFNINQKDLKIIDDIEDDHKIIDLKSECMFYRIQFFQNSVSEVFGFDPNTQLRLGKYNQEFCDLFFITNINYFEQNNNIIDNITSSEQEYLLVIEDLFNKDILSNIIYIIGKLNNVKYILL